VTRLRINVGCGASPTPGWLNFDNSLTVRLAQLPLAGVVARTGVLRLARASFFQRAAGGEIRWADAVRRIPVPDAAAEVVYSSHMLEHLDRREAASFLGEVLRILVPAGKLRIVVPDLRRLVSRYIQDGDADALVSDTLLAHAKPHSWSERLRLLLVGYRGHSWMYDEASLCQFLEASGFTSARPLPPGETTINDPGALNLRERDDESIYVEADKPGGAPVRSD
jgi:hypothetical protein